MHVREGNFVLKLMVLGHVPVALTSTSSFDMTLNYHILFHLIRMKTSRPFYEKITEASKIRRGIVASS